MTGPAAHDTGGSAAPQAKLPPADKAANEISESLFAFRFAELTVMANGQRLWRCLTDDWRTCRQWQAGEGWLSGPEARTLAINEMDALIIGECQAAKASAGKWATRKANAAALALAAAYPGVLTLADKWNADADALGLPGARKVHLPTGQIDEMRAADLIDCRAAVMPDRDCPMPNFERVLAHMSGGDDDLAAFYQLALGGSLYGHNEREVAFFWHGDAASGKNTLLLAVLAASGDYGGRINRETLEGDGRQHLTFLNALRGKRLAVTGELEGEDLRAARFKALVGGDELMANAMRQDPTPFQCKATIHAMANPDCLPSLRRIDEAMRRRIVIVPAGESVPEAERDPAVKAGILAAELPGVLAWLLDGAAASIAGLDRPRAVVEATERYFAEASPVARWVSERCEQGAFEATATELYADFALWWKEVRLPRNPLSMQAFGRALTGLGFERRKTEGRIVRAGIRLQGR